MNIHASAFVAYSHPLVSDVCPTILANQCLFSFAFLPVKYIRNCLFQELIASVVEDGSEEFPAEGAGAIILPPLRDALLAKDMMARKSSSIVLFDLVEAYAALFLSYQFAFQFQFFLFLTEHFRHPSCDPFIFLGYSCRHELQIY